MRGLYRSRDDPRILANVHIQEGDGWRWIVGDNVDCGVVANAAARWTGGGDDGGGSRGATGGDVSFVGDDGNGMVVVHQGDEVEHGGGP